jgi:hypothetical protein
MGEDNNIIHHDFSPKEFKKLDKLVNTVEYLLTRDYEDIEQSIVKPPKDDPDLS